MPQAQRLADPPVSYSSANNNRSRSRSQASRIACISATVSTRSSLRAAFSATMRRACGWPLVM